MFILQKKPPTLYSNIIHVFKNNYWKLLVFYRILHWTFVFIYLFWGEGGLVCSSFDINLLVWDSQLRHKRMRNIWVTSCDYGGGSQNMLRKLNQVFNSMNYMCCTLIFFNCTCILYLFLKWLFWYCPLLWYNLMIKKHYYYFKS